jgi:23S rRNA pseudouridine955/2504/2580 synthase
MALHAWRMAFQHPLTTAPLECIAPVPEGFRSYIAAVDRQNAREFTAENMSDIFAKGLKSE